MDLTFGMRLCLWQWMSGSGVHIFSIMITFYAIYNPAKSAFTVSTGEGLPAHRERALDSWMSAASSLVSPFCTHSVHAVRGPEDGSARKGELIESEAHICHDEFARHVRRSLQNEPHGIVAEHTVRLDFDLVGATKLADGIGLKCVKLVQGARDSRWGSHPRCEQAACICYGYHLSLRDESGCYEPTSIAE